MSEQIGNTIFLAQGEDFSMSVPVYRNGVIVTDITSAKFAYFGGNMIEPVVTAASVQGGGTIIGEISDSDTLLLDPGLYSYEFKMKKSSSQVEQPAKSGFFIIRSTMIDTAL